MLVIAAKHRKKKSLLQNFNTKIIILIEIFTIFCTEDYGDLRKQNLLLIFCDTRKAQVLAVMPLEYGYF